MTERILKTCAVAVVLFSMVVGSAQAGRYHVYSCRTPSGGVAPTEGWSGSKTGTFTYANDTCSSGGALLAALGDQAVRTANTDGATWTFSAPAGDTLAGATLWRYADAAGGAAVNAIYGAWFSAPLDRNDPADAFAECSAGSSCPNGIGRRGEPLSPENRVAVPLAKLATNLYANASCFGESEFECPTGQGDSNNYAAALYLYAADLTLEQTAGPTVSNVGGELATAPDLTADDDLTFTATDPGAGVYEVVFSIDGTVVQTTVPDEESGRCRNVGETSDGLPAFLHLQPCPSSVSPDIAFDPAGLGPGPHHLVVTVLDAAGNSAPVLDRTIVVPSPPLTPVSPGGAVSSAAGQLAPGTPNGSAASTSAILTARWQTTAKSLLTEPFGRRETIVGRLTDPGGSPISGARILVSSTPAAAGAASRPLTGVSTAADGSFVLRLAAGLSSRTVVLSYTAHAGEPRPTATRALQLAVEAPLTLTVTPRDAPSRGTIRFRGRLPAGPIPRGGKALILEARSGRGAWIEFHVVRTDGRGRFASSYHFRFPGPARYQFRVLCEQEADYPFAAGISRTVSVRER
jgi:hypothetical protein